MHFPTALYAIAVAQAGYVAANPINGYGPPSCPADKCFSSLHLKPSAAKVASAFCSYYIDHKPVTKTTTVKSTSVKTSTVTSTVNGPKSTATTTVSITPAPGTVSPTCTTVTSTTQGTFTTSVDFPVRGNNQVDKRAAATVPSVLSNGCGSGKALTAKISSACSCFLGPKKTVTSACTSTVKSSTTVTTTTTGAGQTTTVTVSTTLDPSTVTACQTATTTVTEIPGGATCGFAPAAVAYTTGGRIECTATGSAPASQTNNHFRIEGGSEGTIYDGCIFAMPANVTTPSGGTHLCDGTNNNANPAPGGTFTTDIDATGRQEGFGFDGTYSNQFQDFFISSISDTTQTGNQFWGVLRNRVFTARGGCQEQVAPSDEALWAFDAFAPNRVFLDLESQYAVVQPGQTVTVTVMAGNPNSGDQIPAQGAAFAGSIAGSDGSVTFTAPSTNGCYQYKAELTNAIRSQTFYLTVDDSLVG